MTDRLGYAGIRGLLVAACLTFAAPVAGIAQTAPGLISLAMKDVEIAEVMQMLSRQQRTNIVLSRDVSGSVSFNLFDVSLDVAIRSIAEAAGFAVERRSDTYFIVDPEDAGRHWNGMTEVRAYDIEYADPEVIVSTMRPYLSRYGSIATLAQQKLVTIQDTRLVLDRIEQLLKVLDRPPRQILIEARILEITLSDEQSFGLDWGKLFSSQGGTGEFGVQGLAGAGSSASNGLYFIYDTPNVAAVLTALQADGRTRTLSTPKLLALENQEASVIIGDRRGYTVTTTINQVTTESVEFLESGVILRVTPVLDNAGNVLMNIHPEVSTGTIDATTGIPSQTTTEVTTQLLVPGGQTVFIGGLLKHTLSESRRGVPILGRLPGVKRLFSNREVTNTNTETVVLITPYIVDSHANVVNAEQLDRVRSVERVHDQRAEQITEHLDSEFNAINAGRLTPSLDLTLTPKLGPTRTAPGSSPSP